MEKTSPLLSSIRIATRPLHDNLEQLTGANYMMEDQLDWSVYERLLITHYLFHQEVARHFTQIISGHPSVLDWPACKRIIALERDLKILKHETDPVGVPQIDVSSFAFALGLCYVAEGSCMGNIQLLKAMKKYEDFQQRGAFHFFESCKSDFSVRWKMFLAQLETHGNTSSSVVVEGAIEGFKYFAELWNFLSPQIEKRTV